MLVGRSVRKRIKMEISFRPLVDQPAASAFRQAASAKVGWIGFWGRIEAEKKEKSIKRSEHAFGTVT